MAEEGGGGGGGGDVLFIVLVLIVLAGAWFVSGGAERANLNLFIQPPFQSGIEFEDGSLTEADDVYAREEINTIASEVGRVEDALAKLGSASPSAYKAKVYIESAYGGAETDPSEEYITIKADSSNRVPVHITGWRLESSLTGRSVEIGKGTPTLVLGQPGDDSSIALQPGDSAIISSGRSPVGASFRVNICSGYLEQFQDFSPTLSLMCPLPTSESSYDSRNLGEACYRALESIPRCSVELNLPAELSEDCRAFVVKNLTYNGCVENHRDNKGFARREWRIYLNQPSELWKERFEVIKLVDQAGNLVDSATY